MIQNEVSIALYEYGDWVNHILKVEDAKNMVRDVIKQIPIENIAWILNGMPTHQLSGLLLAATSEMHERGHSQSQNLNVFQDVLKLISDV